MFDPYPPSEPDFGADMPSRSSVINAAFCGITTSLIGLAIGAIWLWTSSTPIL